MRVKFLLLEPQDNTATAIFDIVKGEKVNVMGKEIIILDNISFGHKFAVCDIEKDSSVIKYGEMIGIATEFIKKGSHVHVHNIVDVTDKMAEERRRS